MPDALDRNARKHRERRLQRRWYQQFGAWALGARSARGHLRHTTEAPFPPMLHLQSDNRALLGNRAFGMVLGASVRRVFRLRRQRR
jgi:hypothetical protein